VPVRESPLRSDAAIDQGDAKGPLLHGYIADLDAGAFDDRQHDHVTRTRMGDAAFVAERCPASQGANVPLLRQRP
jgi:hypothetical protein